MKEIDIDNEFNNELAVKIKIPKQIKENIYMKLFKNLCMAIAILIYFIFINLGYLRLDENVFRADLQTFAGILIVSTILVFELAYKKDSMTIALYGVELLVLSIITLFLPYVFFHRGIIMKFLYASSAIYISIYYVAKCIVIYIKEVRKYKSGLSDIKEIIEEDENESYLEEANERKFEEYQEEDTPKQRNMDSNVSRERKKDINNKVKEKNEQDNMDGKENKNNDEQPVKKKRGRKPKIKNETENVEEKKNIAKKTTSKRKTTAKSETKKRTTKTVVKSMATSNKGNKEKGDMKND